MLRISTETKMKPEAVIKAAAKYFTEQFGLKVKEQDADSIELEGGGGGVAVVLKPSTRRPRSKWLPMNGRFRSRNSWGVLKENKVTLHSV